MNTDDKNLTLTHRYSLPFYHTPSQMAYPELGHIPSHLSHPDRCHKQLTLDFTFELP
jgi:hypothetical protein